MADHQNPRPPKWANRFLEWFCCPQQLEILQGDLYELYKERLQSKGKLLAQFYFIFDVLDLIRPFAVNKRSNSFFGGLAMFDNYLKVSRRTVVRQKMYSSINIAGLAIGIACFLLIFLYINDELSYDQFHSKSDRIYRLIENFESDSVGEHSASQPFPSGPTIMNDFSGIVEQTVRLFNFQSPTLSLANVEKEREFNESRVFLVDSTFFDVFDFKLLEGNRHTVLDNPNSIVISQSMVKKYFGDEDPMGQILQFQGSENLLVTGIVEDAPLNAHFQYDFLISMPTVEKFLWPEYNQNWYWNPCWTYVLLNETNDAELLSSYFPEFVQKYFPEISRDDITLELQPLAAIHLTSKLDYEIQPNGDEKNIFVFSAVAAFVLLIAIINFINLSSARATKRAKEVGVRKSLGSNKGQLIKQFIFESMFMVVIAVMIAISLVLLVLPQFNSLADKSISLGSLFHTQYITYLIGLTLTVGLISGCYPAFVLSSFEPIKVLKNSVQKTNGLNFRKALVIVQFSISMILIIGTIITLDQLRLLQNSDLGFNKEHVAMVPVIRTPMSEHFSTYKTEVSKHSSIISVTALEEVLGAKHQVGNYQFEGMEKSRPFPRLMIRHDFPETFNIPIVAGRSYSKDYITDDSLALLVNETLVKHMGWESNEAAIGKRFDWSGNYQTGRKIVGVVSDFNFVSKHHPISPIVLDLRMHPRAFNLFIKYMAVRIKGDQIPEALTTMRETWKKLMPERPFEYFFLDDRLNDSYKAEEKLSNVAGIFSFLAILVACLGLFGLATFTTEQRTKEIGIRKVLGISNAQIMALLSKEFLLLILISFGIAAPLSFILISGWLDGFAYRVDIGIAPFIIAGSLTIFVALFTVSFHSVKASLVNPVRALKYE